MPPKEEARYAAVLLSRQARRPCCRDLWVIQTRRAVEHIQASGWGIVSSVGMPTWELVTTLASLHRLPLKLVSHSISEERCDAIIDNFELDRNKTAFIELSAKGEKQERWSENDSLVVAQANILLPVSVRRGGSMARRIVDRQCAGGMIDSQFLVEYDRSHTEIAYAVDIARLCRSVAQLQSDLVVHWTRSANRPWPGEKAIDFYRSILCCERYCRTGFDTLIRMLRMRRIIASTRHMPRQVATVSFSGLPPIEVVRMMKWRARYGEMSFEPYGIGLSANTAKALGIRAVEYHNKDDRKSGDTPLWLRQSSGVKTDWRAECEYRHRGDLDFATVLPDDLTVFCLYPEEAAAIRREFGLTARSFYSSADSAMGSSATD